jgi:hypothetical protein
LHDGPVRPPPNPKNHFPARCSIRISVFPGPQTKKAQQGLGTASGVVVFGGFGVTGNLIAKDLPLEGSKDLTGWQA